jgi:hypothetical protein
MLLIYGRRSMRIKKYTDNQQCCKNCKTFEFDVKVYRSYFHIYYIPVLPFGNKTVEIRCKSCGEPLRDYVIQKHYVDIAKTPFYLYSLVILIAGLFAFIISKNLITQKEKARFVNDPKVGDVYGIRKDENNSTTYYFLRASQINGDTVLVYHSNLEYSRFVSRFNENDFFVKDEELIYTKKELKAMLDKGEINSIERDYGGSEGFNRMK